MSLLIFTTVLGAAFLHALWNGLVRVGASRVHVMMILSGVQGLIGLAVAFAYPFPEAKVWPWLVASGIIHSAYKTFLTYAYEHGDLSRVYPLARGTAPLIVLCASATLLGETPTTPEVIGLCLLGLGILLLAGGVFSNGESRRLLPYAFGAAAATAGYSMVDGMGARVAGEAGGFVGWLFVIDGLIFAAVMLGLRGTASVPRDRNVWLIGSLGAAASYTSYAIVVWAMTKAPIALVAGLRETSIVFGVLIGWFVFRERMTRSKLISIGLIVAGVVVTRL